MLPLRCAIVDDKPLAIDVIRTYIEQVPFLTLVHATTNPLAALPWVDQQLVDVIFLDIQMPELTGVQFMKIVEARVGIVLTTAYTDYALEGFEHSALDYLLKPVSFERFYKAALKAKSWLERRQNPAALPVTPAETGRDYIFVKTDYKIVKIAFPTMAYAEAKQNYTVLHTTDGKIMTLQPLKQLAEQLPSNSFVRVHKSYLVNLRKIEAVERNQIYIGEARIPIGETYQSAFLKVLNLP